MAEPTGTGPNPPVLPRAASLPFLELGWENFERLCYRLAQKAGKVEKVWAYGSQGHEQLGIDVLVRMTDGSYETWQSKRHQAFHQAQLTAAVNHFLKGNWANKAKKFTLAVACNGTSPPLIDAIEKARDKLAARGITFEPLFERELSEKLKTEAEIVDDLFGRPWLERFCAAEHIAALADRISRVDINSLRMRLRSLYTAWIGIVDPGLPLVGQIGAETPSPELSKRYVLPEVILPLGLAADERIPTEGPQATPGPPAQNSKQTPSTAQSDRAPPARPAPLRPTERRTSVNQLLGEVSRVVISADAGAGKTTLLRYLALQLLSDTSDLQAINERFAGYVPVWVPFALWARMSEGKDRPPPLEDVVHGFVDALNECDVANAMRRALKSAKVVLLVDGLDETRNQAIADTLLVSLSVFAETKAAPVLATSRPHGVRAFSGIGTWSRAQLAPLSDAQRSELALLWYRILERQELGPRAEQKTVERQAKNRADAFTKALLQSLGIGSLSRTPLFLLSLLKLHRLGRDLPRNRFDASQEIVQQLIDEQPKRRAKDAMKTELAQSPRHRDRLLEDFAFGLHAGELRGSVADGAFEKDAIARATSLVMARNGNADRALAEEQARSIFLFNEEVAGLLVKKATNNVGFLHRSLQEYFAGAHLSQKSLEDRAAFITAHASQSAWKEPILYLLYLTRNEQEVERLLEAVEQAPASDILGVAARDALLTEAAFADFEHDLPKVRALAKRFFDETELDASGARQHSLVSAVVDGLFSQSVSAQCADKLAEWIPDYHGWSRQAAVLAMRQWDEGMRPACIPVLLRILAGDLDNVARAAAQVIAEFCKGDDEIKKTLLRLFHQPRSIETMHAAFIALGLGWAGDDDVAALALELRHVALAGLRIDAIRVRAQRNEADLNDLNIFAGVAYKDDNFSSEIYARDLVEYFSARHKNELLAHIESALTGENRGRKQVALLGALILVDPSHRLVEPTLRAIASEDWSFNEVFGRSNIPLERVTFSPKLTRIVEERMRQDKHHDYNWYWVSKVLRLPSLKARMIESMKSGKGLSFWSSGGLAKFWGKDDPEVVAAFHGVLDGSPTAVAEAAEALPAIIDDSDLVRAAILKALHAKPKDTRFLVRGLRLLGLSEDEEAFKAAWEAGDPAKRLLYDNSWREELFLTFGSRPEVRELARKELRLRDGEIGAVATAYADDAEMCGLILKVLAPLPETTRLASIPAISAAATSDAEAFSILTQSRFDTDGATSGEAVMAWTEVCVARGEFGPDHLKFLVDELDAVGPEFSHRRAAGIAGIAIADRLDAFAPLKDHSGKPVNVDVGSLVALDKSDRYIKRILPRWDRAIAVFGSEDDALTRFQIAPETTLPTLDPGTPNAKRLFALLYGSTDPQLRLDTKLGALRRFAPEGTEMRSLIEPLIRTGSTYGQWLSNRDRWPSHMAAEIFAEHFAHSDLYQIAIDQVTADPESACAVAALAETVLREHDAAVENLLETQTINKEYDLVTVIRLTAAIGNIAAMLEDVLRYDPEEINALNCGYWVPAVIRRIETDDAVVDELIAASQRAPSASARLSELTLLARGCKDTAKIQPVLESALQTYESGLVPTLAYDVTAESYLVAAQAIRQLLM
ncbi:NACHT domain-containing protein [Pseudorhodoplanes sinuspersici]|nr:NACHT domain-containing protein [Pseudorhodoplanes sinuspersici]